VDIEGVRTIVEKAVNDAFAFRWLEYLIAVVIFAFSSFLGSYLKFKGQNHATKEDINSLTDAVENIKFEYTSKMEELSHQNRLIINNMNFDYQLRLAALEKRLEAHQKAYLYWRKLLSTIKHPQQINNLVMECQEWWDDNCLYLSPEVRIEFKNAYSDAFAYQDLSIDEKNKWHQNLQVLGDLIVKAVSLPTIGKLESEVLS
jgi:hypothetical protein